VSDTPQAVEFLRGLEPNGPWLLVALKPTVSADEKNVDLKRGEFYPETEAEMVEWIDSYQGRFNLYYTSNLPRTPFLSHKKEAIDTLRVLHVDVDLPGDAADAELSADLLARFRELEPKPTALVFTGGGYQAIWKLDRPLFKDEWEARVEAVNRAIWTVMRGDPCHDINRLLRLPGTVNCLNFRKRSKGREPTLAYVVEADWSRAWSFERDAVPRLPEEEIEPNDSTPQAAASGDLAGLTKKLRGYIDNGNPEDFRGDRSRMGWFVMCALVRLGWTDEHITEIFMDRNRGVSSHYLEQGNPRRYVARNLERARAAVVRDFKRNSLNQILSDDPDNNDKALDLLGARFTYDSFADRIWLNGSGPARLYNDDEARALWVEARRRFNFLPRRDVWDATITVRARRGSYHPVRDYLAACQTRWDGVLRVGGLDSPSWLTAYGKAEDTAYVRAVGRLTLVAACRRVREPGCKFDEILMLVSVEQGTNKSTAIRTLAVNDDWFNDYVPLGEVGREVIEHIRGFWLIEASELAGLRTREIEKIKSFCSRQHDRGRMSYDKMISDVPRSCVFIGTTNQEELFTDLINRRFWPVRVKEFDIAALERDRDQIWAEASVIEAEGASIRLNPNLYADAAVEQSKYRVEHPWTSILGAALGDKRGRIRTDHAWDIIHKPGHQRGYADSRNIGEAMRELEFTRRQYRVPGRQDPVWFYVRGDHLQPRDITVQWDFVLNVASTMYADEVDVEPAPPDQLRFTRGDF
jgi:hypothetical protein